MVKNNIEVDLKTAKTRLEQLEAKREVMHREHGAAITVRREQLLNGNIDSKALVEADDRVVTVEAGLSGLEDALAEQRNRVTMLTKAVEAQRHREICDLKARETEARIPAISKTFTALKAATAEFVDALRGSSVPEAAGVLAWTEEFAKPLAAEVDRLLQLHKDAARAARTAPPPSSAPFTPPTPALVLQPHRLGDIPDTRFVDWTSPEARPQR